MTLEEQIVVSGARQGADAEQVCRLAEQGPDWGRVLWIASENRGLRPVLMLQILLVELVYFLPELLCSVFTA